MGQCKRSKRGKFIFEIYTSRPHVKIFGVGYIYDCIDSSLQIH